MKRTCNNCLYGQGEVACMNRDYKKCAESRRSIEWRPAPKDKLSPSLRKMIKEAIR